MTPSTTNATPLSEFRSSYTISDDERWAQRSVSQTRIYGLRWHEKAGKRGKLQINGRWDALATQSIARHTYCANFKMYFELTTKWNQDITTGWFIPTQTEIKADYEAGRNYLTEKGSQITNTGSLNRNQLNWWQAEYHSEQHDDYRELQGVSFKIKSSIKMKHKINYELPDESLKSN